MKTLFEEMMKWAASPEATNQQKAIYESMDRSEIIHIQNVADYYFEISDQEHWIIDKDFPNLAPPFPFFWMEYKPPQMINGADGKIPVQKDIGKKIGILVGAKDVEGNIYGEKWALNILLFIHGTDGLFYQPMSWIVVVDNLGRVVYRPDGESNFMGFLSPGIQKQMGIDERNLYEKLPDGRYFMFHAVAPALLAISFMHCKNVQLVSNEPKSATGHKRRKKNESRIKYYTLHIEPMKKILREEGKSEETGIKHALHICRGHFKDYRDGNGLFGRYKELIWWESQVRGRAEHGVVLKDYNVNEPSEPTP